MKRFLFVVNPIAGRKDVSEEILAKAAQLLPEGSFKLVKTEYPGHAHELAKQACSEQDEIFIISCGGDGTLNEVLCGMHDSENAVLGIYPCGTGNDFIKSFNGDIAAFKDLNAQLHGDSAACDYMTVNGRPCLNIASVGLDAAIAENVHRFSMIPLLKKFAYELSLGYCFFTKLKNRMTVTADQNEPVTADYIFVCAANGRCYGGGFYAAPEADTADGLIDLVTVRTISRFKVLGLIGIYKKGKHIKDGKTTVPGTIFFERCKMLKIQSEKPVAVNVDGEVVRMTNPVIKLHKNGVKVLLPQGVTKQEQGNLLLKY